MKTMEMYKCRTCSKPLSETAITCPHCGDIDAIYNNHVKECHDAYLKKSDKIDKQIQGIAIMLAFVIPSFIAFITDVKGHWWQILILFLLATVTYFVAFGIGGTVGEKYYKFERTEAENTASCRENLKINVK